MLYTCGHKIPDSDSIIGAIAMAYLQKDTLMPQLLVCLGLFSIVVIVICSFQCLLQKKSKKEKEIQRVLKMAMNENC